MPPEVLSGLGLKDFHYDYDVFKGRHVCSSVLAAPLGGR